MATLQILAVVITHPVQLIHASRAAAGRLACPLVAFPWRPAAEETQSAGAGGGVSSGWPLRQVLRHVQSVQRELDQGRQLGGAPLVVGLKRGRRGGRRGIRYTAREMMMMSWALGRRNNAAIWRREIRYSRSEIR